MLWEPAGWEHSGSNLAEFRCQAWQRDGDGEKISVTVCGSIPQLRYLLTVTGFCCVSR